MKENIKEGSFAKPTRAQQIFLYIAPFPPLAAFKIWASLGQEGNRLFIAALVMFTYCLLIITLARRWDKPSYFDWAVTAYFSAASLFLGLWPESAGRILTHYAVTGIYLCLFAAAFLPPLFGFDPFTYHYAKKQAPQEVWDNPVFMSVNRIMTHVWSGLFLVCIAVSLYPSVITRALIPIGLIVGLGFPFNLLFPDYYLKRLGLPSLAEQQKMAEEEPAAGVNRLPLYLPGSAWEAISGMPLAFNPQAAGDMKAVIGFIVSGAETFEAYLHIENGACSLKDKPARKPDLMIRTPADVWLGISRGELDGQQAFTTGAYKAQGNLGLLLRLKQIFGAGPSTDLMNEIRTGK